MNIIVTICAMISLSGVLCGHALALTPEQIINFGDNITRTYHALHEINAVTQACSDGTTPDMSEQLFNACIGFYETYGKHLQAVLNEGNSTIQIITK